jgi:hypothetical protein
MKNPNLSTKVVHSESNDAWNVVGTKWGGKYKIARCPYIVDRTMGEYSEIINTKEKAEALTCAEFISWCFNHSDTIIHELVNKGK